MALTLPLALEIVKRLWVGTSDVLSIFGSLLAVLLAASPLTLRGRELAEAVVDRLPFVKTTRRAEAMLAMSVIAFGLVLVAWLSLPRLARWYNNRGYHAATDGNLAQAQSHFRRAVALSADLGTGYYHLATIYEGVARPDEAITWYLQAIEHDLDLVAAYNKLGRLYILEKEPSRAVQVLHAGLLRVTGQSDTDVLARYRLLSNLGWAYFETEQTGRALQVLEQAIALESSLAPAFKSAVAHYYLALIYEASEQLDAAHQHWESSLRYLNQRDVAQAGWNETIMDHLEKLERGG